MSYYFFIRFTQNTFISIFFIFNVKFNNSTYYLLTDFLSHLEFYLLESDANSITGPQQLVQKLKFKAE
jgi:hypothetical protein